MEKTKIWHELKNRFLSSSKLVKSKLEDEGEKGVEYYNKVFEEKKIFHAHYTSSPYYGVWTVILDRLRRIDKVSILEIGCGTGQLAWLIYDSDLADEYVGFDLSEVAIKYARRNCPKLKLFVANALETNLYEINNYNVIISTEFLEHVERDLDVIKSIRGGTIFIGSVPSYPFRSHVRYFPSMTEVINRYSKYFSSFEVIPIRVYETKTIYLFQGIKN